MIRTIVEKDWPALKPLWNSLYEHQRAEGLLVSLPPNAYDLWVESFRPLLDRFATVLVADENDDLVGFLAGSIRSLPTYFGGERIGYVSEIFVAESHRRHGIGDELLKAAREWFARHDAKRMDLHVLTSNGAARDFYRRRGWTEELVQMTWQVPS